MQLNNSQASKINKRTTKMAAKGHLISSDEDFSGEDTSSLMGLGKRAFNETTIDHLRVGSECAYSDEAEGHPDDNDQDS